MPKSIVRIAIVDEYPIVRRGVEAVLAGPDFVVVASVGRTAELAPEATPDLVVLGPHGHRDGPRSETIAELRSFSRVLLVCAPAVPLELVTAIRAGAGGYLTAREGETMIVSAARTVAAGGFAVSAEMAGLLHTHLLPKPGEGTAGQADPRRLTPVRDGASLSPREREALCWIARGLTHAQTATRMGVSKPTVDTYVARARVKLKLGNKADLTRAALQLDATLSPAS